jgi:hypothetical protein
LAIRGGAERTQQSYSRYVSELARYYHRSPELISYHEVADWLYYLVKERELSASSVNIAVNAVRFLYGVTLGRNTDELMASVPRMKHAIPLQAQTASPLSRSTNRTVARADLSEELLSLVDKLKGSVPST